METMTKIKDFFINYTKCGEDKFNIMCENTLKISNSISSYHLEHKSIIPHILYEKQKINPFYIELIDKYTKETTFIQQMIKDEKPADIYLLNLLVEPWKTKIIDNEYKYVVELDYECEQLYKISEQLSQSMSDYFITMSKMIDIMWNDADSIVGPARGSAGSSIINYLLGITQIDPLNQPVELPFWRFIHADRPGLPD